MVIGMEKSERIL